METQCIVDFEGNITTRVLEDCPKAALDEFQDQSLSIFSSTNQWIIITLVVVVIGCLTMTMIGKTFIIWYVKFQSIDRPLNALIVLDQGIQLLPVLVNGIGTTVCLILKKPLVTYIGQKGCRVWSMFSLTQKLSLIVGGAGMAVYRLSIYRFAHRISDCKAIRNAILLVETITFLALFITFFYKTSLTQTAPPLDFCRGHTPVIGETINLYNGVDQDSFDFGKKIATFGLILVQSIILIEVTCYVVLYYWKKKDSLSHTTPMSKNMAKRRIHQSTITLSGQVVSFAIETTYLLILRKTMGSMALEPIYTNFMWFAITMTQIITSSELRSFLLDF